MKAKKLVEVLDAYAEVLEVAGNETASSDVKALGHALVKKGALEVAFILEVVSDGADGGSDAVEPFLQALGALQKKSGAKKFAEDFFALSEVGKRTHLAHGIEYIDLVRYFGKLLSTSPETLKAIQPILKTMSAAGVLNAKEAVAVAANYVGGPGSYKNKKAALEAIRDRVARNEGLASKASMS